eukprot:scaffold33437_cov68-Attheya_sp.AAC.4
MKRPTRSDPTHVRVTKFDELNDSDNESSSSTVLVTSSVYPFHQDLVTCCKTLLKGSEESNQSMVASEIEPCSSLNFSNFLDPDLDHEVFCDFQQCIEDETKNEKHRNHSKITELLQQGSTRVLFLYFNHLRSLGKKHESSQLDEEAGGKIHVQDDTPSFNKSMFCVVTFSVDIDIGISIDYCGTTSEHFSHFTTRAPSNYSVCGCGLMNFLLHVSQCIGWIVSAKLDTCLICPTVVSNFYRRLGFKLDPTMSTRNELEPFCIRFDLTNLTNLKEICPMSIIGKPIKRRIEKLHDMRWHNVSSENKAITITKSSPPDKCFPHNFISQAIDDEMKRNVDLLSRESCEKYLRPFLYVMDKLDPRGLLDIAMASKYWSSFFVRTFTAWAGTQGNTKHHFDRCMLKTISGNLP